MDLASVVAALASVGVRVSGSTPNSSVQVDSSRASPTGLAGPEPSSTINDPGQHFHTYRLIYNSLPQQDLDKLDTTIWSHISKLGKLSFRTPNKTKYSPPHNRFKHHENFYRNPHPSHQPYTALHTRRRTFPHQRKSQVHLALQGH